MYEDNIEKNEVKTYVQIPEWQWNDAMRDAHKRTGRRPVCELLRSLYGHPNAGLFWERKYRSILRRAGFREMIGWECMFYHSTYQVIISVYVDDFKMAGTRKGVQQAWNSIRGPDKLILDDPTPFGAYLGCEQNTSTIARAEATERVVMRKGRNVTAVPKRWKVNYGQPQAPSTAPYERMCRLEGGHDSPTAQRGIDGPISMII